MSHKKYIFVDRAAISQNKTLHPNQTPTPPIQVFCPEHMPPFQADKVEIKCPECGAHAASVVYDPKKPLKVDYLTLEVWVEFSGKGEVMVNLGSIIRRPDPAT